MPTEASRDAESEVSVVAAAPSSVVWVKRIKDHAGLTHEELAEQVGCNTTTAKRWTSDKAKAKPDWNSIWGLFRVAVAHKVRVRDLEGAELLVAALDLAERRTPAVGSVPGDDGGQSAMHRLSAIERELLEKFRRMPPGRRYEVLERATEFAAEDAASQDAAALVQR